MKNSINSRTYKADEKKWSFFLPFAFLLSQYGYGLGGMMITYFILFAGYCVFKYSEFPVFKPLSIYTLWYVAVLLGTVLIYGHAANIPYVYHLIQILIVGYAVTIIAKHVDKDSLYRCWKVLGLIVCLVVLYQFVQIFVFGHSVLPIRLLPVRSQELALNENWTTPSDRPVAFFTEPAMVIAFLTPVLLFAQQKKEFSVAIIVSIAILLTGSTSGVVALLIMWGYYIVSIKLSRTVKIIMFLLFIAAIFAYFTLDIFSSSVEKINHELSGNSGNMDTRMLRGWWIYAVLDWRFQLFGISDYDIASFVYGNASEFTWQTGYEETFYLNTAQRILIQTGAVGAVLYIWMLVKLWTSTNKAVKPYLLYVIVSIFFASNFYINGLFGLQYVVLLSYLTKFEEGRDTKVIIKRSNYVQKVHQ